MMAQELPQRPNVSQVSSLMDYELEIVHENDDSITSSSDDDDNSCTSLDSLPAFDRNVCSRTCSDKVAERNMNSSAAASDEAVESLKPKPARRRTIRFNEIVTIHVFNPMVPPAIPALYRPALQKTVLSQLSHDYYHNKTSTSLDKVPSAGPTKKKKPDSARKRCVSTAA